MQAMEDPGELPYGKKKVGQSKGWRRFVQPSALRFMAGSLCILVAVASWVLMAEKLQRLNKCYFKPSFLTYWVHSFYTVAYVLWKIWSIVVGGFSSNKVSDNHFSTKYLILVSGVLALLMYVSAYFWYVSLKGTSIPANTSIYQSACAIVFIISVPVLRERVTVVKVVCVLFSLVGVILIAIFSQHHTHSTVTNSTSSPLPPPPSPSPSPSLPGQDPPMAGASNATVSCANMGESNTVFGYIALIISTVLYASFEVFYKRFGTAKRDASPADSVRMLGMAGVHTLFWMWPITFVLHFAGLEHFEWPSMDILEMMLYNAFLDLVFNGCLLVCIALTSPLFASVGTIIAIPTAMIVDKLVQHYFLPPWPIVGVVLIVIGFVGFVISEAVQIRRESAHEKQPRTRATEECTIQNSMASEISPLVSQHLGGQGTRKGFWRRTVLKYVI